MKTLSIALFDVKGLKSDCRKENMIIDKLQIRIKDNRFTNQRSHVRKY